MRGDLVYISTRRGDSLGFATDPEGAAGQVQYAVGYPGHILVELRGECRLAVAPYIIVKANNRDNKISINSTQIRECQRKITYSCNRRGRRDMSTGDPRYMQG